MFKFLNKESRFLTCKLAMGDFVPNFERRDELKSGLGPRPIPTAGAIPVKNEKGQIVMKKVKVQRYIAGKAPEYARARDEDYGSDEDTRDYHHYRSEPRGRRGGDEYRRGADTRDNRRGERRFSPSDIKTDSSELKYEQNQAALNEEDFSQSDDEMAVEERRKRVLARRQQQDEDALDEGGVDVSDDEDDLQKRRDLLKLQRKRIEEEELLAQQDAAEEISGESEEEESEEEADSEEEDEEMMPRLKPVFVKKVDRVTLIEIEKEQEKLEKLRVEEERRKEERKRESERIVQDTLRLEEEAERSRKEAKQHADLDSVLTDDEGEELAYELWKVREMKRLKRNRDEREQMAREREEIDRIHSMSEEQRREYLRQNPKLVTNKQDKGKYKFLQKYFHRGAYFLDKEDDIYRRNFAEATGEDEFDKSVLPKVMQVKNFGKASRSKWTHLTQEDTTDHQGIWATPTPISVRFLTKHAAGFKNNFEKPSIKKRKIEE